jgi:hypothetical protein
VSVFADVVDELYFRLPRGDSSRVEDLAALNQQFSKACGTSADLGRKAVGRLIGLAKERSDGQAARLFAVRGENLDAGLRDLQHGAHTMARVLTDYASAVHTADKTVRALIRHAEGPITEAYGQQLVATADEASKELLAKAQTFGKRISRLPWVRFADNGPTEVNPSSPAGRALARDYRHEHIKFDFSDADSAQQSFANSERRVGGARQRLVSGLGDLAPAIGSDIPGLAFRSGYDDAQAMLVRGADEGAQALNEVALGIMRWRENTREVQQTVSSRFSAIGDALG